MSRQIVCFALALPAALLAQRAPATLPDVRLSTGGAVNCMALQEDGKLIIGGFFESVNGLARRNLARINPNGSVDATWNPNADGRVLGLALDGTNVYAAGEFWNIGGQSNRYIAKLSLLDIGSADPGWHPPTPNFPIACIALSGTNLFAGGWFTSLAGIPRRGIAKLSVTGTGALDPAWNPDYPNGQVFHLAIDDTNLFVGGAFTRIGGQDRNRIAKLSTLGVGATDPAWNPGGSTNVLWSVSAMAVSGSSLLVGGTFDWIGGQPRNHLAKLGTAGSGTADPAWNPDLGSSASITALSVVGTNLYLGGSFTSVGGIPRKGLAKTSLLDAGTVDPVWNPQITDATTVESLIEAIVATESSVYVGGEFRTVNNDLALGLARFDAVAGGKDPMYPVSVEFPGSVWSVARQPDGKLILGGDFYTVNGVERRNLARIKRDGGLDFGWNPRADGLVWTVVVSGNDVFAGGYFNRIGNLQRKGIAKLSALDSDAADPVWDANASGVVWAIAVTNNDVYVGGSFISMGGLPRKGIAKLDRTGSGTTDPLWNPNSDGDVFALALAGTNLYVGGRYTQIGGKPRSGLARLSIEGLGSADPVWDPHPQSIESGSDNSIYAITLDETNLFVSGDFDVIGGQTRKCIAKLSTDDSGLADASWNPIWDVSGFIYSLAVSGTNLYAGGDFDGINSQGCRALAKISTLGAGNLDWDWMNSHSLVPIPESVAAAYAIQLGGTDLYVGGAFNGVGGATRVGFAFLPVADAPVLLVHTNSTLILFRNPADGYEVTHFQITDLTGVSLFRSDGVTAVRAGDFISVEQGIAGLRYVGTGTVTAVSALNDTAAGAGTASTSINLNLAQPPVFRFASEDYFVPEASNEVTVTVQKWGGAAAAVLFSTSDGTAVAYDYDTQIGDYEKANDRKTFLAGTSNRTITVVLRNASQVPKANRTFWISLTGATGGGHLAYPATTAVTIVGKAGAGQSVTTNVWPSPLVLPDSSGVLSVSLQPTSGQWRLMGDDAWHDSGASVSGLVSGIYQVELRPLLGYLDRGRITVKVVAGMTNYASALYYGQGATGFGSLRVFIQPDQVATNGSPAQRGRWRLQGGGEADWHESGHIATNLTAGYHVVEWQDVANWVAPMPRNALVMGDQEITGIYLPSSSFGGQVPSALTLGEATTNRPYLYNGQIETDAGFGSGVVVKPRVVLTAAHVLFDDRVLSFVTEVNWLPRKSSGEHEPVPQRPRGWYVFEGYAAQRQVDKSPGYSTPQSQHLDAAALYFVESPTDPNFPAGGGYGGYLSSDALPDEWLSSERLKMLVGYPLDGVSAANRGKMHATVATNAHFSLVYPGVYATADLKSSGGNSGGPLYVRFDDGQYYPAGIYLGGWSQTLVRAIDSEVVDLINRAEVSGSGGGNSTGGGVVRWEPGVTTSRWVPGLFWVNLAPQEIIQRGAGWRVQGASDPTWLTDTNLYYPLIPGAFNIEFKPVTGYGEPALQQVIVVADQTTRIPAAYTPLQEPLIVSPPGDFNSSGYSGGPFSPLTVTYTLTNPGTASIDWWLNKTAAWLSLSASSGTLAGGVATNLVLNINTNANWVAAGIYTDTVGFSNLTSSLGNTTRQVTLTVVEHPPVRLINPRLGSDNRISMTLQGVTNRVYSILVSTNLLSQMTNWMELLRFTNTAGETRFTNGLPSYRWLYYRAKEQ